jgi:hypothetical protein
VARSAEDDFTDAVRRALQSAWGAALDVSTSEDFRNTEGELDEEAYLSAQAGWYKHLSEQIGWAHRRAVQAAVRRDRRQRQRPTNSGPPGSVPPD